LNLDNSKILFILFGKFAESVSMIIGLLVKQLLRVLGLMLDSIQQLIQLILECLVLNLCEILLVLQPLSGFPNQVFVVEEVPGQLVVDSLSLVETASH
jgi:hypothetical protein